MIIYSGSINVEKIDKSRLYKGEKGTYLNFRIWLKDEPDQYGSHGFVAEEISKEERQAGQQGTILGNVRRLELKQTGKADKQPDKVDDGPLPF